MDRLELNGNWQFKAVSRAKKNGASNADVYDWMTATVPGTVHTDLLNLGKIPDPFYRMNELDVQWVEAEQWVYRKEFVVGANLLAHDKVFLVADGLDTFAEIRLNGKMLGESADMFVEHRFDAKRVLRIGRNVLEILFGSPMVRARQLEARHGALQVSHESPRAYVRKAQYSFGWDWGPKLTTSGIWRPVYLEGLSGCRIKSVFAHADRVTKQRAEVTVDVAVERTKPLPVDITINLSGNGFHYEESCRIKTDKKSVVVTIPNPQLWWPNGCGEQSLYRVDVTATVQGKPCDAKSFVFGIRTVRLLQEKDDEGKTFVFEINGVKIYCKGADWIPSDNFIPRIQASTYERLLTMARDANMTMVRVWGGGIYEQELFYELCDRLGLMVWQDFMFACSEYPENGWFLRQVRDEAEKAVSRLRNHPSIVVWCGNNECEWIYCRANPGKSPDEMSGATIFRDILPSVCRTFDGTRPYWRSSPFGSGFPNDESNGNHHEWDVWGLWKDYRDYEKVSARFVTEFGFQAPASPKTMERVTVSTDRYPQSEVLEHHNKLPEGTERLYRFQASHLPVGSDYEDFVYKGQVVQAEALKTATEHWRRRKFKTAGSMFWQLNDCWPVSSWSVIDSALRPKAAYYFARKFYAPVLVSFRKVADSVEVWVTNDLLASPRGDLRICLRTIDGKEPWRRLKQFRAPANGSRMLARIRASEWKGESPSQIYLHAQLQISGQVVSENRYFFVEPKHVQWQPSGLTVELTQKDEHTYQLSLRSKTLARYVFIDVVGEEVTLDDNFFDVDPGIARPIGIKTTSPLEELRKKLTIHSLGG